MVFRDISKARIAAILGIAVFFILFLDRDGYALRETHLDRTKVAGGCAVCHKGHGKRATVMLTLPKDDLCLSCHGQSEQASQGRTDIYSAIVKSSSHPILQTSQHHVPGERLPENSSVSRRHVSCFDCHNAHKSEKGNALKGVQGYSGRGMAIKKSTTEYEVCYRCHADQGNPAYEEANVALDFAPTNASFHPVEKFGKSSYVPSLKKGYSRSSLITCSDCHGNNDPSGPKGPHGSIYEPILKHQYTRTPGPEGLRAYELCYSCHDRNSILGDESFKSHKIHVVYSQISCSQCHDAHGSRTNPSLINFDETVVYPNSRGELTYLPTVSGQPRCYLTCHLRGRSYDHKLDISLRYCINNRCAQE
jgi:predicted CXXCH cytochrome family protein